MTDIEGVFAEMILKSCREEGEGAIAFANREQAERVKFRMFISIGMGHDISPLKSPSIDAFTCDITEQTYENGRTIYRVTLTRKEAEK